MQGFQSRRAPRAAFRCIGYALRIAGVLCVLGLPLSAREYFASPTGSPRGTGQRANPWDLATALSDGRRLVAGDTLYLMGGTYRGQFTSRVAGSPERPITIRPASGQRPVIDCRSSNGADPRFAVDGSWCVLVGLEFTCSDPRRVTQMSGSWPADVRRGSVSCSGRGVKLINLIIHDLAGGPGFSSTAEGGEIYGCIIYNNGWLGPDRGHGHGIYAQNRETVCRIADNIIFNQFGFGIHCYGSDQAALDHFELEGNILFNNGCLTSSEHRSCNILLGGDCPVRHAKIAHNVSYMDSSAPALWLGFGDGVLNQNAIVEHNYLVGRVRIKRCEPLVFRNNRLFGEEAWIRLESWGELPAPGFVWENNRYQQTNAEPQPAFAVQGERSENLVFDQWRRRFPGDAASEFAQGPPRGVEVIVRPNQYEPGRAHIAVLNWDQQPDVPVDLNGVLQPGQRFRIVSAQNYAGSPLVSGVYQGEPVRLPMAATPAAKVIGYEHYPLPITEPVFGAFVVLPER